MERSQIFPLHPSAFQNFSKAAPVLVITEIVYIYTYHKALKFQKWKGQSESKENSIFKNN